MGWRDLTRGVMEACKRAFGEEATYTPVDPDDDPFTVTGIFDEAYQTVELGAGAEVSSVHPMLGVKIDDMAVTPARGDEVEVRGVDYVVIDCQTDGHAGYRLILQKKEI